MLRHFTDRAGRALTLRVAEPADAPGLIGLSNSIRAEGVFYVADDPRLTSEDYAEYLRLLDGERHLVLLATDGERVVGTLTAIGGGLRKTRHVAEIGIGVAAGWRDAGLGSALLTTAIEWCRQRGLVKLELSVFANNERAIRLYQRYGFREEGRRTAKYRISGEYVDEVLMGLLLSDPQSDV